MLGISDIQALELNTDWILCQISGLGIRFPSLNNIVTINNQLFLKENYANYGCSSCMQT